MNCLKSELDMNRSGDRHQNSVNTQSGILSLILLHKDSETTDFNNSTKVQVVDFSRIQAGYILYDFNRVTQTRLVLQQPVLEET